MTGFLAPDATPPPRHGAPSVGNWYARRTATEDLVVAGASSEALLLDKLYKADTPDREPRRWDAEPWARRLFELSRLRDGWDGGCAPAPSQEAIRAAHVVMELSVGRVHAAQVRCEADAEGGVATYFFGGPRLGDGGWALQTAIFVTNDGDLALYLRDRRRVGQVIEDVLLGDLALALDRIGSVLDEDPSTSLSTEP